MTTFHTRMGSDVSILPTAQKTVDAGWVNIIYHDNTKFAEILIGDLRSLGGLKVIMEAIEALIPPPSDAPTFVVTIFIGSHDEDTIADKVKSNWYRHVATYPEIIDAILAHSYLRCKVFKVDRTKRSRHEQPTWIDVEWATLYDAINDIQLTPVDEQRIDIYVKPTLEPDEEV